MSKQCVCGWQSARCNSALGTTRSVVPKTSANTVVGTRKGNMNFEFLILNYELFVTMGTKIAKDVPQYAYCST